MIEQSPLEKYADPSGPRRMIGCSQERVEEQIRIALDGHPESELWGENGLIAATMRAVNSVEELTRQRDEARKLARELRDALKELADNGHTEECDALNYANKHCDCGVDSARMLISKAKEVLP